MYSHFVCFYSLYKFSSHSCSKDGDKNKIENENIHPPLTSTQLSIRKYVLEQAAVLHFLCLFTFIGWRIFKKKLNNILSDNTTTTTKVNKVVNHLVLSLKTYNTYLNKMVYFIKNLILLLLLPC